MTAIPTQSRFCPHCDYSLEGLAPGTQVCPECGGSLSPRGYALAEARRISRSRTARLALLASPGVGIIGGVPAILIRHALLDFLTFIFASLWIGGTIAVYFARERRRRNLARAVLVGLPIGILYFIIVVTIAIGIAFLVKMFSW